jgi:DHA1 family multidrug resistance protein-like MFS transporter
MINKNKYFSLIMLCNGFSNFGHFSAYALLAIYFINTINLSINTVSYILLFMAISFRFSRVIFTPIIDLLGCRVAMSGCMILCTLGYIGLTFSRSITTIIISLLVIGIGYGTNSSLIRYLTSTFNSSPLLIQFARLSVVTNVAAAIGPFIGNIMLMRFPNYGLCLLSASAFLVAFIFSLFLKLDYPRFTKQDQWVKKLLIHIKTPQLKISMLSSCFGFFLYTQLFSLLPLYVCKGLNNQSLLGFLFILNSIIVIFLSLPINNFLSSKRMSHNSSLLLSFIIFLCGLILLGLSKSTCSVYISVLLWTISEIIMIPTLNKLVVDTSDSNIRLMGFSINAIAIGIGEGGGNFVGASLAGYSSLSGHWNYTFSILAGINIAFILILMAIHFSTKKMEVAP